MIRTEQLSKRFALDGSEVLAVDGLSLLVRQGEVFGFLGPNGAGKTTTVRMLAALITPSSGRAWIDDLEIGRDDMAIRSRIGILTESPGHYERLTVRLNLEFFGRLHEVPDLDRQIGRYLDLLGLSDKAEAPAGTLSKGMKQKLAIARALLHEPPVLFLDEPTSALDPEASKTVRDFIESLRGQGRTIFLCTHNLDEAERLCDRIGVFRQRLIAVDTPEALRRQLFGRQTVVELAAGGIDHLAQAADAVGAAPGVQHVSWEGSPIGNGAGRLLITLEDPAAQNPAIVRALVALGVDVRFVSELHHSLEDIYLSLINEGGVPGGGRP